MRWAWRLAAALAILHSPRAEPPDLKAIQPIGAAVGTTNQFTLAGKFDPWPPRFWIFPGDIACKPSTNKNKISIEIPSGVAPGPRLIRVFNEDGVSDPRFFIVGGGRETEEKEPNNRLAEAQEVGEMPTTISGALNKNDDADCYRIDLRAGAWLEASLDSYTLMSKVDAVFRLVTTNGVTLAWNHDHANFDPRLWWRAPVDQTVILQVFGFVYPANAEVRLSGGEESYYRLNLSTNAPEPWVAAAPTNVATLPFAAGGVIAEVGQEIRHAFAARKGEFVSARVEAATLGSALDPWLKITDAAGKQLAREDDSDGGRDPRLEWKAPADTNFFLVVGSTLNRAGSNYFFRASATAAPPDFRATFSASSLVLPAGTTNAVKVDFKRLREHTNELSARLEGLPPGVTAVLTNLPAKSGEVSFSLVAETNAPAFQGPVRLLLIDAMAKSEKPAVFELTTRGENNGVPNGYSALAIESFEQFWLTVKTQAVALVATNSAAK